MKTKSEQENTTAPTALAAAHGSVICGDCGTVHHMGNGVTCAADKPLHIHLHSHCPVCGRKTWSEPFVLRSMTKAGIAAALSSPNATELSHAAERVQSKS